MMIQHIELGSDLDDAAEELFTAVRKYRETLKRNHKDRLAGVVWVTSDGQMVLFSECEKYTNQIKELTFDPVSDSFTL